MKITKQDIKTLNKLKNMCMYSESCKDCKFNYGECILQFPPTYWELDDLEEKE